jgi:hypothetical protein
VKVFVDLKELGLTDAKTICETFLLVLNKNGFTESYLKQMKT